MPLVLCLWFYAFGAMPLQQFAKPKTANFVVMLDFLLQASPPRRFLPTATRLPQPLPAPPTRPRDETNHTSMQVSIMTRLAA